MADILIILQSQKPYISILSLLSVLSLLFHHLIEICVRTLRVEDFVAVHDTNEVFGVAQIDDVVGVARKHDDALNLIARDLIVENLGIRVGFISQLNKSVSRDYCEVLELAVVPVLALGDSGLGDIDAHLTMGEGVEELGEAASGIDIHLVVIDGFLLWEVAEIGGHELVAEAALREFNHVDALLVGCCFGTLVDNVHDFAKGGLVGYRHIAISASRRV